MGVSTSFEHLVAKVEAFSAAIPAGSEAATLAAGEVLKRSILSVAHGPKKSDKWVDIRLTSRTSFMAALRGGFAYLTQKGSYKKPDGYTIAPKKVTQRRINNAAKKGVTLAQKGVIASADRQFVAAYARHPAIRSHPFWGEGIAIGVPLVRDTYERIAVVEPLKAVFG